MPFLTRARRLLLAASTCTALSLSHATRADDNIFPPAPAAKASIDFDGRGFLIGGQRAFLTSGSLHYARVPRAMWRDRLLRFKNAGFNTVQTYVFWNAHEPQPGVFNFQAENDLDGFLKEAKAVGLYAVVRVGPYICAEWDSGGYPVWLKFVPGLRVREPNAPFEAAVSRFLSHIWPIVASNQIHRGGNVIMVQLENEHPRGWGRDEPNSYFTRLRVEAVAAGIAVPMFFSGLHHGSDPAGGNPWDSKGRQSPWYTTEFWPGWYNLYGPLSASNERRFDRGTWKILAYGGAGYNYYMLHGGTNFGYSNNNEDASCYDYGAAVGQAGDLRPIYFKFKRAALFAQATRQVLADSENASDDFKAAATNADIRVTARRGSNGTILFLDNNGQAPIETQVKLGAATVPSKPLKIEAGEIVPIVTGFALTPQVKIVSCAARILNIVKQGKTTTLVIYGQPDTPAEVSFGLTGATIQGQLPRQFSTGADGTLVLRTEFDGFRTPMYSFGAGAQRVRVLVLSSADADQTYFPEVGGQTWIVCGAPYVSGASLQQGRLSITIERPMQRRVRNAAFRLRNTGALLPLMSGVRGPVVWGAGEKELYLSLVPLRFRDESESLLLSTWQGRDASAPAQPAFNDASWKKSMAPLQMGADGDVSAYAWYRARVTAPRDGRYKLAVTSIRDRAAFWLDGRRLSQADVKANGAEMELKAGAHTVAIFAAHDGRDKLFNYLGPLDTADPKGLFGAATLSQAGDGGEITGWRLKRAANDEDKKTPPASDAAGWEAAAIGADAFNKQRGAAWFQATLPNLESKQRVLHFESVDENATVFLNGQQIGAHRGWNQPFDAAAGAAWKEGGPNILSVLIENEDNTGGIDKPVTLVPLQLGAPIAGWAMRGGPGDALATGGYAPLPAVASRPASTLGATANAPGAPRFFRSSFIAPAYAAFGPHPIWRVVMAGMSRGFVWLNGRNLGRYPEKVPVEGLYLPEAWLRAGSNSLVVFDEEGRAPNQVRIVAEKAASWDQEGWSAPVKP